MAGRANDRFQQQVQFQIGEFAVLGGGRTVRGNYRFSHTRINESSCSTSTGLLMYSDAPAAMQLSRSPFMAFAVNAMIGRSREPALGADAPDRLVAVHFRHHDVHQYDVEAGPSKQVHAFLTAFRARHLHACSLESAAQSEDVARVVVDDQHALALEAGAVFANDFDRGPFAGRHFRSHLV